MEKKQIERRAKVARYFDSGNPPVKSFEYNDGSSITDPDPGLTLKQMVEKYVLGEQVRGHEVYFDESEEGMVPAGGVDLADITEAENRVIEARENEEVLKVKVKKTKAASEDKPGPLKTKAAKGNGEAPDDEEGGTTDKE